MLRWRIAILISAAIAISYLDRQTLPVAIGEIRKEIPISNQVKAFLDSAFLVTYGLMYLGGGRLMDTHVRVRCQCGWQTAKKQLY